MTPAFRSYDRDHDREAALRVLSEVGWLEIGNESHERAHALRLDAADVVVADLDGSVECAVATFDGDIRYRTRDLPLVVVGGVVTGRVARRQRFASSLTAESVARAVIERGASVAILGMFEEGFYDRLGFGTGAPMSFVAFDPASLAVEVPERVPVRLTAADAERVHESLMSRHRLHGACRMAHPDSTRSEVMMSKKGFGLGFADSTTNEITHHVWCEADDAEHGPYRVKWLAYRDRAQFLELMGLLKSLADQVNSVVMPEPPGIQLQALITRPFHRQRISRESTFASRTWTQAWWQARICDLEACLAQTQLPAALSVTFHLRLTDPIERHLSASTQQRWAGVAGDYVVTLAQESHAERVQAAPKGLANMTTSVNTFTRLWLGVSSPSALAFTSPDLDASVDLLEKLDHTVLVHDPNPGMDF